VIRNYTCFGPYRLAIPVPTVYGPQNRGKWAHKSPKLWHKYPNGVNTCHTYQPAGTGSAPGLGRLVGVFGGESL